MITVFKLNLEITDEQKVRIQRGARILKVGEQRGVITVWFVCDPEAELVEETFYVVGTGQQLPDTFPGLYIDSVQMYNASDPDLMTNPKEFVWHIFFKPKAAPVQRGKPFVADPNGPRANKRGNPNASA